MFRKMTVLIGTSTSCGAPIAPTIEPGRAMANAVAIDWFVPTHSSAASTPTPSVIAMTASVLSLIHI